MHCLFLRTLFTVLQDGETALMKCTRRNGCIDIVRHLVRCGKASVNTPDNVSVQ